VTKFFALSAAFASGFLFTGCDFHFPGEPHESHRWQPPSAQTDFAKLYSKNCQACHSIDGTPSAAIPLNSPVYLAIVPREALKQVIANGVPGATMPGFSTANGGPLTDAQIDIIVDNLLAQKPADLVLNDAPAYSAPLGNPATGAAVFETIRPALHSADTGKGGLLDPAFLSLVSNQYLRTSFIAGRPELGIPDYRSYPNEKVLTSQEISDLVAWLSSQRPASSPLAVKTSTLPAKP
jgi:cytochrome c oxidase cbb3-type subunit 3